MRRYFTGIGIVVLIVLVALSILASGSIGNISAGPAEQVTGTMNPFLGISKASPTSTITQGEGAAITVPPPPTSTPPIAAPFMTMTAMLGSYTTPTPRPPLTIEPTGRPQLLYFHAYWCAPCREMRPIIRHLEDDYGLLVDFYWLNVDESANRELITQYQVRFVPTIILLDEDGRVADLFVGYTPEEILRRSLERLLPEEIESV